MPESSEVTIDRKDFKETGLAMITARDKLDYDDWNEVKLLTKKSQVVIVEEFIYEEAVNYGCSCYIGVKGKLCIHSAALYMKLGTIDVKTDLASKTVAKKKGRVVIPKKQP